VFSRADVELRTGSPAFPAALDCLNFWTNDTSTVTFHWRSRGLLGRFRHRVKALSG